MSTIIFILTSWASMVAQWWRICLLCRRCRTHGFNPWVKKVLWKRKWQPTPIILPGKSREQRSLTGPGVAESQTELSDWQHRHATFSVALLNFICVCGLVTQSCLTICDPTNCSPSGSSIHGIFQARILEGLPFPSPEDFPGPGIKPRSPALQADSLPSELQGRLPWWLRR